MIRILRQVSGKENWPNKPVLAIGEWEVWEEGLSSLDEAGQNIIMSIDIAENDGDVPSAWRVEVDGVAGGVVDASKMTPEERTSYVPDDVREAGREGFGELIRGRVDEALKQVEEDSK